MKTKRRWILSILETVGDATDTHLHALAWGRDERRVLPQQREKSVGSDETFAQDIDDPVLIHRELLRLADRTAARVRSAGLMGRTVTLKVRFADFTTITRSRTLRDPTDVSREIYAAATALFDAAVMAEGRIVRELTGDGITRNAIVQASYADEAKGTATAA